MGLLRCSKCKELKPADDFHRHNKARSRTNRASRCKPCSLDDKRRYYETNREGLIKKVQARTDPHEKREYDRAHNQKPEVRAKRAAQRKAWAIRNADSTRVHNKARSAARRKAPFDAAARDYGLVILRDPCSYCGGLTEHMDHVVPLKLGGDSSWDNLTAACQRCNFQKTDKPLLLFLLNG